MRKGFHKFYINVIRIGKLRTQNRYYIKHINKRKKKLYGSNLQKTIKKK